MVLVIFKVFNRRWHISTTPNTTKRFCKVFKLMQQSNMVTLSCLAKKNQNLSPRKKKFSLVPKMEVCGLKTQQISIFSTKLNFFPRVQTLIVLHQATQGDHIRLLYQFKQCTKILCHLLLTEINVQKSLPETFMQRKNHCFSLVVKVKTL